MLTDHVGYPGIPFHLDKTDLTESEICFNWYYCRYCCSGAGQRLLMAMTSPLPQPPMSLQILHDDLVAGTSWLGGVTFSVCYLAVFIVWVDSRGDCLVPRSMSRYIR